MGCTLSADHFENRRPVNQSKLNQSQLERERYEARINPLQMAQDMKEEVPQDVLLTRMWNSVVCGEFVKNQTVLFVSPSDPVLAVVQSMVQRGADFVCIREPINDDAAANPAGSVTPSPANAAHSISQKAATQADSGISSTGLKVGTAPASTPSTSSAAPAGPPKKQRWNYISLFDWRDLNSLLVLACKRNQLHMLEANKDKEKEKENKEEGKDKSDGNATGSDNEEKKQNDDVKVEELTNSPVTGPQSPQNNPRGSLAPPSLSLPRQISVSTSAAPVSESQLDKLEPFLHFLDLKRTPIGIAANLSNRNPLMHVHTATPLLGGATLLVGTTGSELANANKKPVKKNATAPLSPSAAGSGRPELYRLMVLNKDKDFIGALSQLDCMKFISSKIGSLGTLGDETLLDLGLGHRRVQTIGWKAPVITAISLMHEKGLSSVAIIDDEQGKLVGSISTTDVRYLFQAPELLLTLQRPVSVFVAAVRHSPTYWMVNIASNPPPVARSPTHFLTSRSTLNEAIKEILAKRIRRIWIVNDNHQPIGVLSISDIVKFLLPQPKGAGPAHNQPPKQKTKTFLA